MKRVALFSEHSRSWRENRFVYPVISRRSKGLSIGVNLNPDQVCNFDCVYCCVDRSGSGKEREEVRGRVVDLEVLRGELREMLRLGASGELFESPPFDGTPEGLRRVNDVAFSGDGEPTSCGKFGEACRVVVEEIERAGLARGMVGGGGVKVVVITNATLLQRAAVVEALRFLDGRGGEVWAKLDAGTEGYYKAVDRSSVPLGRVLENILAAGREREIVIQSMFMRMHGEGPGEAEVGAYVERLRELVAGGCRIKGVQVYTVARRTAEDWVGPLSDGELAGIVERVRGVGLEVEGFGG